VVSGLKDKNRNRRRKMKKQVIVLSIFLLVGVTATAFGWGSNQHPDLANMVMNDPSISPYLTTFGLNQAAIAAAAFEPPNAPVYQWPGWPNVNNSGRNHNGFMLDPNFVALDETTRIGYILHNTCDEGVPLNHAPANQVYIDQYYNVPGYPGYNSSLPAYANPELYLETPAMYGGNQQPLPGSMPTLYTGTYAQNVAQFLTDELDLSTRYMAANATPLLWGQLRPADVWAAQEGYTNALRLSQVVLQDYFRLKMPEVAMATSSIDSDGNLILDSAGSYDPDGDVFSSVSWILNGHEVFGARLTISAGDLVSVYGMLPGNNYNIQLKVVDDNLASAGILGEGSAFTTVPEPATLVLITLGGLAFMSRRKS
jgi:hypothetical protein